MAKPECQLRMGYVKYRLIVDEMADLARHGVEFRMCNNAMHAAGFRAEDMDSFITVTPAGFAEIIYLESLRYIGTSIRFLRR